MILKTTLYFISRAAFNSFKKRYKILTMKKRKVIIILFAIWASCLIACSKDGTDGEIGPQGEQGIQGEAGPAGQDGTDGQDGEPGTANVIYSDWVASEFPEDINDQFYQWSWYASELTQEIHDSGVILIYSRKASAIYPLPNTFFGTVNEDYGFRLLDINDNLIAIRVQTIDGGHINEPFLNDAYRYIIIPGGMPSSGKSNEVPDYSKMSYPEICEYFNIPE